MTKLERAKFLQWDYSDIEDDILYKTEVQANKMVAITMINSAIILFIVWLLNIFNVFSLDSKELNTIVWQGLLELIVPAALCFIFRGRKKWLKWILVIELTVVACRIHSLLGYYAVLFTIVPTIISSRYYKKIFTEIISIITVVLLLLSTVYQMIYGTLDLNIITLSAGNYSFEVYDSFTLGIKEMLKTIPDSQKMLIINGIKYSYLPNALVYSVIAIISVASADKGRKMVLDQALITSKSVSIESELSLASEIQSNMLPSIFPPFPDHPEFDIYATMTPAKEVGGDFYDFFMIDEKHVAVVIGDVSGKGVPAALFMVTAKTLIKDHAVLGYTPGEVFTRVNKLLCEGNEANLFVTAWIGILDLENEVLHYSVAGHNPPLIYRSNGSFEYLKSRQGFVLGGMDTIRYKDLEIDMKEGDKLFLYTDGVTEATDKDNNLYGEERLKAFLNENYNKTVKDTLVSLKQSIDDFVCGRDQFDDITMLILDFNYKDAKKYSETFDSSEDELDKVNDFIDEHLDEFDTPYKTKLKIDMAVEEIFVNISNYAYKDLQNENNKVTINISYKNDYVTIEFIDNGIEFNPLLKEDPDTTLSVSDREIGGLGILMVKKTMDKVVYDRINNSNIFKISKRISE